MCPSAAKNLVSEASTQSTRTRNTFVSCTLVLECGCLVLHDRSLQIDGVEDGKEKMDSPKSSFIWSNESAKIVRQQQLNNFACEDCQP